MEIRDFRPEDRQEYLDMSVDFYSGDASLFDVDMKKLRIPSSLVSRALH